MTGNQKYRKTLVACYLGFVTQAISANFVPLLFLTFKSTYGITLEKIAMIPLVFYLTQLFVDLAATKLVDKIGYRICVVFSQILSAVGLALMAILLEVFPSPFVGILISVALYAMGSGLIEVLVSPIVEACPFENKEGTMSLLHSFYCLGAMGVIIGSTLFFSVFGVERWKILTIIWALVPLYNTFNFINCPIERLVEDGESMGISRMLYGKFSEKLDLTKVMLGCGIMCACCYLLASLSTLPILGLAGCALCGLAVGIMWPGSISLSSKNCPRDGTAMFAFLALAGDLGAMVSPSMVGTLSEMAGGNLKEGLLVATIFPLVLAFVLMILNKKKMNGR